MKTLKKTLAFALALAVVVAATLVPGMITVGAETVDMDEATYGTCVIGENVYDFSTATETTSASSLNSAGTFILTKSSSVAPNAGKETVMLVPEGVTLTISGGSIGAAGNVTIILDGGEINQTSSLIQNGILTYLCTEKGGFIHTGTKTVYENSGTPTINFGCPGMQGTITLFCSSEIQNGYVRAQRAGMTVNVYDGFKFAVNNKGTTTKNTSPSSVISATATVTVNIFGGEFVSNHLASGSDSAVVTVTSGATVNVYGGEFYNNISEGNKGGVFYLKNSGATLNVFGGHFHDNANTSNTNASVLQVESGTVNLYGGTISNNHSAGASAIVGNFNASSNFKFDGNTTGDTITVSSASNVFGTRTATAYSATYVDGTEDIPTPTGAVYAYAFYDEAGMQLSGYTGVATEGAAVASVPADQIKVDNIFDGWMLNGVEGTYYSAAQIAEMTFAAETDYIFTPHFTEASGTVINFDANTGDFAEDAVKFIIVDNGTLNQADITASIPTKAGYKFLGWAETADATSASESFNITESVILYAVWTVDDTPTDVVVYNNDGTVLTTVSAVADGTKSVASVLEGITPEDKTGNEYVFKGWSFNGTEMADTSVIYYNYYSEVHAMFYGDVTVTLDSTKAGAGYYFFTDEGVLQLKTFTVKGGAPIGAELAGEINSYLTSAAFSTNGTDLTLNANGYYSIPSKTSGLFYYNIVDELGSHGVTNTSITDKTVFTSDSAMYCSAYTSANIVSLDLSDAPAGTSFDAYATYQKFLNSDSSTAAFYYNNTVYTNGNYRTSSSSIIASAPEGYAIEGYTYNYGGYYLSDDTNVSATGTYYVLDGENYVEATAEQKVTSNRANLYEYYDNSMKVTFPQAERSCGDTNGVYYDRTKLAYNTNGVPKYRTYTLKPTVIDGYKIDVDASMLNTGSNTAALTGAATHLFDSDYSTGATSEYALVSLRETASIDTVVATIGKIGYTATLDGTFNVYLFAENPYTEGTEIDLSTAIASKSIVPSVVQTSIVNAQAKIVVDFGESYSNVNYVLISGVNRDTVEDVPISEIAIYSTSEVTRYYTVSLQTNGNKSFYVGGTTSTSNVTFQNELSTVVENGTVIDLPSKTTDWNNDAAADLVSGNGNNYILLGYYVMQDDEIYSSELVNSLVLPNGDIDMEKIVKSVTVTDNIRIAPIAIKRVSAVLGATIRTSGTQGLKFIVADNSYTDLYGYTNVSYGFYMMKKTNYDALEDNSIEGIEAANGNTAIYANATTASRSFESGSETVAQSYGAVMTGYASNYARLSSDIICIPTVTYTKGDETATVVLGTVGETNTRNIIEIAATVCANKNAIEKAEADFAAQFADQFELDTDENKKLCYLEWVMQNA